MATWETIWTPTNTAIREENVEKEMKISITRYNILKTNPDLTPEELNALTKLVLKSGETNGN
jgi:hypothetical protein